MKQNLMQLQLKLSNKKKPTSKLSASENYKEEDEVDYTSKAFYIANQLMATDYLFSKRALVTHLQGKPIILQQKHDQQPPLTLKGYMEFEDEELIERILDTMIDLNILAERKVSLKKRFIKRLFTTKKFQFSNFPKVYVNYTKIKKSVQLTFTSIKEQKPQHQKIKQKSRLSSFLITKNSLPVNIQKKEHQIKMKIEKEKEQQHKRKRKHQEESRLKKQQKIKASQNIQQKQFEVKKNQQEKQTHLNKMNNFWLKEKQKIQTFVSPSKFKNNYQEKNEKQKQKIDEKCQQMTGSMPRIQMKQLQEQQEQRKNLKPLISWSFMKQTLGIDSSQRNNQTKQQALSAILVINEKISQEKSSQKQSEKNVKFQFQTKIKLNKQQKFIEEKSPFLNLNNQSPKMEIQQQEERSLSFANSESTDVTMTNYRLQKKRNKDKVQVQLTQKQQVFAKSQEDSMFSNSYYVLGNKMQQTVTNKKGEKNRKSLTKKFENKKEQIFDFKRKSTTLGNEEIFTIVKKSISKDASFEKSKKVEEKVEIEPKIVKRSKKQENEGEMQHTMTLAMPKQESERRKGVKFVFEDSPLKFQTEIFIQAITTPQPQPKTKNKEICGRDLYPIKSEHKEKEPKRDSFVEQLIGEYYKKKPRNN